MIINVRQDEENININGFAGIVQKYNYMVEFLEVTDNFHIDFLDTTKGDKISDFLTERSNEISYNVKKRIARSILKFLEFITLDYDFQDKLYSKEVISSYMSKLIVIEDSIGTTKYKNNFLHLKIYSC